MSISMPTISYQPCFCADILGNEYLSQVSFVDERSNKSQTDAVIGEVNILVGIV